MADVNATLYRVFLTHDINTYEAYPYGFEGMNINGQREKLDNADSVFIRRFLDGKLIFRNNPAKSRMDYDWIKAIEDGPDNCLKISVQIKQSCDGGLTYSDFWLGYFTTSDGEFNLDECVFTTDVQVDDLYACILDKGNDQFNIIKIGVEYTVVNTGFPATYQFSNNGLNVEDTFIATQTVCGAFLNFYWREVKWTNCVAGSPVMPSGAGWVLDTDNCSTDGQALFARPPLISAPDPSIDFVCGSFDGSGNPIPPDNLCAYILVTSIPISNISIWWCPPETSIETYTHCRKLSDVLDQLVSNACPDLTNGIYSDFFEINPIGDAPGYVAGVNYVTGQTNRLIDLFLSQKSDVLLPLASQSATIGNITFLELMSYLQSQFNVRWWIINNNAIRIEHISYFNYSLSADFTVNPFAKWLQGSNVYSHIQEQRPRREKFKWMEAFNVDFVGTDIVYDFACIASRLGGRGGSNDPSIENSITYDVNKITTDIQYIVESPGEISHDGFVMFCTIPDGSGGTYTIFNEPGLISNNIVQNGHLSWANLHYNYHRHFRVLLSGTMNNVPETFFSARPTKQQDKVVVEDCCDGIDKDVIDSEIIGKIKTQLGNGIIANYKKDLKNDSTTFKLLY